MRAHAFFVHVTSPAAGCRFLNRTSTAGEPPWGFEPQTCGLRNRCSTPELRWQKGSAKYADVRFSQACRAGYPRHFRECTKIRRNARPGPEAFIARITSR